MIVDDPQTKAEVEAAFAAYETALTTNDVGALDGFFHEAPTSVRYGGGENLYGSAAISRKNVGRSPREASWLALWRNNHTRMKSRG